MKTHQNAQLVATWSCRTQCCSGLRHSNRQHYELAATATATATAQAEPDWLADLITRQVPIGQWWADAYARQRDDIKTVLTFPDGSS